MSQQQQQQQLVVPRAPTAQELRSAIENRPVDFNALSYFKKGWTAFKVNFCQFWGTLIVYFLVSALILFVSCMTYVKRFGKPDFGEGEGSDDGEFHPHHWNRDEEDEEHHFAHKAPKSLVIWAVATLAIMYLFLWIPMKSSFFRASFKALRTNSKLSLRDAFSSYSCPYFCRLLWLNIVVTALSCIFGPFSSALVGFFGMFVFGLHADNDHLPLGVFSSLKLSTQAVMRHFCGILAFSIMAIVLNVIGVLAFGIGLLITLPVTWFAFLFVYHDVIRINGFPVVASAVPLSQVTIQQGTAVATPVPVVTVAPGGYTQLQDDFSRVEGAC